MSPATPPPPPVPAKPVEKAKADFSQTVNENVKQTWELNLVPGIQEFKKVESITDLVDLIVLKAWQAGASDVHIDPSPDAVIVRYRVDGIMHDIISLKKDYQPFIITRIKILAGMRTDEHYSAQDGRFRMTVRNTQIDLRVSIISTYNGENVVLRLLVSDARSKTLAELGFNPRDLGVLEHYIRKPHGMILATGPTGSGKTSTLYSILSMLNKRDTSIVTIEDPIEFAVEGLSQIQVNTASNLTFAAGLRSILRQDPNTILVGEIRDSETAGIAVNAAMTGHRVLSTLHTTDAATTLPRLLDMGIEPFLIASTVNVAVGQRLVRRLCPDCHQMKALTEEDRIALTHAVPAELLDRYPLYGNAVGCKACNFTGYSKRMGIYEVLESNEEVRKLIMKRSNADELREMARKQGMTTMLEDGISKASQGITSIAEILRVILD